MIFVITHKMFEDSSIDKNHYKILQVGAYDKSRVTYLRDDIGEHISHKNSYYCELTGLYWIWKNNREKADEITGIVHYRRFFTTVFEEWRYTYFGVMPKIISYSKVEEALKKYDIILPRRVTIFRTVKEFYGDIHCEEDLDLTRKVIEEVCPEYLESFDKVMGAHYFYYGNMMLCRRELLDAYCEWLFPILCKLESKIDINKYADTYQKRVYGFIAERLLQVWVEYRNLKIVEFAVYNTEERRITIFQKNKNRLMKALGIKKGENKGKSN